MTATTSSDHRYFLVRCEMVNRTGDVSLRYVEHQTFRLWQYLMANKHHLQVRKASLCLWIPQSEWDTQPNYFQAAGTAEPVTLLRFDLFDASNAIYDRIQRFVATVQADEMQQKLLQRIPAAVQSLPDFSAGQRAGYAIVQQPEADLTTLGQALSAEVLAPT